MLAPTPPLKVSEPQREVFETLFRSQTAAYHDVQRAKALLMASDGFATTRVAKETGVSPTTVTRWRECLERDGQKASVKVGPGRGRKPSDLAGEGAGDRPRTLHEKPAGETLELPVDGSRARVRTRRSRRSARVDAGFAAMRRFHGAGGRRRGRAGGLLAAAAAAGLCMALPSAALASANDVRVRFTGAMETFHQPNAQPSNDEIVNIRKEAWDFVWDGTVSQLDSALGKPRVLLATGQALTTFTDRAPCRATLAYIPASAPFVVVMRHEGPLDVAAINTLWNSVSSCRGQWTTASRPIPTSSGCDATAIPAMRSAGALRARYSPRRTKSAPSRVVVRACRPVARISAAGFSRSRTTRPAAVRTHQLRDR